MMRQFVLLGAAGAFLAVALGAFGAHGLKGRLSPEMLAVYQTGVQYHITHALALLLVALLSERLRARTLVRRAGWLFALGILVFSGSLYILSLSGDRYWGMITPLGGVCFLTGWALLVAAALREPGKQ